MKHRVVVTGVGMRTPLGHTPDLFFENLIGGRTGIKPHPHLELGCEVASVDFEPDRHFSKLQQRFMDRSSQLAVTAAQDAARAAGLPGDLGEDTGVFMGTSLGGLTTVESHYERYFSGQRPHLIIPSAMPSGPAAQIAIHLGITGECQTYSSACASAAMAIGEAFRKISDGYLTQALAGGTESTLLPGILAAWQVMGVVCQDGVHPSGTGCRPFSQDRTGFSMGEGAAILVLETLDSALQRDAQPLCEIVGYGLSCDATHIVNPDQQGQVRAMRRALKDARIEASQIGYINAHATGTTAGDVVEAASICEVFGERAGGIPVSSTKSAHGHMLGATGAVEFVAMAMALKHQMLPPTTHWQTPDPACAFDCVPGRGRPASKLSHAMSNSFGFGGNNAVLVAKAYHG